MAQQNSLNNKTSTLTVDDTLTVTAGDATVSAGNLTLPATNAAATEGAIIIGTKNALNTRGLRNILMGELSGSGASFNGNDCIGIGYGTLRNLNAGNQDCIALGHDTMSSATSSTLFVAIGGWVATNITTGGVHSVFLGQEAASRATTGGIFSIAIGSNSGVGETGNYNISIGYAAGLDFFGAESSNIAIGNRGTTGDNNKMRLGTDGTGGGQVDTVVIAGTNATISGAATAGTVNIATGAAAKTVTLGSTNTTSKLDLKYGTADFTLASATGTVIKAEDTGEVTMPLQPSFGAFNSAARTNVTGNGTSWTVICDTELFDRGSDYNNGTYTFTAPVTGIYNFNGQAILYGMTAAAVTSSLNIQTTAKRFISGVTNPYATAAGSTYRTLSVATTCTMTAGDTAYLFLNVQGEADDTVNVFGSANVQTYFNGNLVC